MLVEKIKSFIDVLPSTLHALRSGFSSYRSGSIIDYNIDFNSYTDLVSYFPRALQIGFLSPFPDLWFNVGQQTGRIGRMISGLEMIFIYILLFGFIWVLFFDGKRLVMLLPMLILSFTIILLLGYFIAQAGTILRMRQAPLIPFFVYGVYGISMLKIKLNEFLGKFN